MKRKFGVLKLIYVGGALFFYSGCQNFQVEHEEAKNITVRNIDFTKLKSGTFLGSYEGGMYQWRSNKVKVEIDNSKVNKITLVESAEKTDPTPIYNRIIEKQSLVVDGIAGATLTSKAFIKGVENAVEKAVVESN